jgi:hypothetical protein
MFMFKAQVFIGICRYKGVVAVDAAMAMAKAVDRYLT